MSKRKQVVCLSIIASLAIAVFVGCSTDTESQPAANSTPETKPADIPDEMSGISELPESEQAAALEQKICPVSDKPIGSMGKPIKVSLEGQDVFVCCEGCVDMVKEEPEKYLAKLNKK